jgi:fatty-acyl-CoA synthase
VTKVYRTELTPLSFLERAAVVFGDKTAMSYGDTSISYTEMAGLATRVARALQTGGVDQGDRVAFLCPNIPEVR